MDIAEIMEAKKYWLNMACGSDCIILLNLFEDYCRGSALAFQARDDKAYEYNSRNAVAVKMILRDILEEAYKHDIHPTVG